MCPPPDIPRDAASFNPPTHTLGLPLRVQVAVHIADGIGRSEEGRGGHAATHAQLRGRHALAALVGPALTGRRPLLAGGSSTQSSMRLWTVRGVASVGELTLLQL